MIEDDFGNLDGLPEIDKLMRIVEYYFPGKSQALRATLGAVASLAVSGSRKTIPLWIYGEPGVSKSTILEILGGGLNLIDWSEIDVPYALFVDNFSPKSFRSAHVREDAEDLLDRLGEGRSRVLVTTELNVLWGKPQAQLHELCSQITKVCDDNNSITYAHAGRISGAHDANANNFVWLGATISIPEKVSSLFSVHLGPRLYFYNMSEPAVTASAIANDLERMAAVDRDYWPKILICQQAVAAYVQAVNLRPNSILWNKTNDRGIAILSNIATVLRVLRAGVPAKRFRGKLILGKPVLEAPKRCMDIAVALARGQAILRQVNSIALEDISIVCKIMIDTAAASYPERAMIFRKVLENNGSITIEQLVEQAEYAKEFLIVELEKLVHLNLITHFDGTISFTEEYFELAMSLHPYILQPLIQERLNE